VLVRCSYTQSCWR